MILGKSVMRVITVVSIVKLIKQKYLTITQSTTRVMGGLLELLRVIRV